MIVLEVLNLGPFMMVWKQAVVTGEPRQLLVGTWTKEMEKLNVEFT